MGKWDSLPNADSLDKAVSNLQKNGINARVVQNSDEARREVLKLVPKDANIMTMASVTLKTLGLDKLDTVKKKLSAMNRETDNLEMQKIGAAPEWAIGSVHAVTEEGNVMIASKTGSQLPAYAYGSMRVIWVVGAQKIVRSIDEGLKRIYEHSFPLEDARARKIYGEGSGVNKVLIINKEIKPERLTMIIIKEVIGF